MTKKIKDRLKPGSNRTFLAKDFESFRQQLIEDAAIFFPTKIRDFSEASVAGMLVDMAASVGDTMSFYLDHQFREMDPSSAVEFDNINTHLINAGVKIQGASPAAAVLTITLTVPAIAYFDDENIKRYKPKESALPYIFSETSFESESGVIFNLTEDLDFAEKDANGFLKASAVEKDYENGVVKTWLVSRNVDVLSGNESVESFTIEDEHVPFRELALGNANVTQILSVYDSDRNRYYEVDTLSQDTVFEAVDNTNRQDNEEVPMSLEIKPAPRRFVVVTTPGSFSSVIRFGSGNSEALDDDIAPDPSELALPLYGRRNFPKFSIDPNSLVETQTLGLSPKNTTIEITYRHGGGIGHNVDTNTITDVSELSMEFRHSPIPEDALSVRQSISVTNPRAATGGADAPDIEFLRSLIPASRNSQNRIVTKQDLLARIYTLPSIFGRVFRVGLSENSISGMSLIVKVISLDKEGNLTISPDTLKKNLSVYLNEFRLLSDAIDVLDAKVLNYKVQYEVFLEKTVNKRKTLTAINRALAESLDVKYFQIDQPIIIDDILNVMLNTPGVISVNDLQVIPIAATQSDVNLNFGTGPGKRTYSTEPFETAGSIKSGILRGDPGTIFELRYPEHDIIGYAV